MLLADMLLLAWLSPSLEKAAVPLRRLSKNQSAASWAEKDSSRKCFEFKTDRNMVWGEVSFVLVWLFSFVFVTLFCVFAFCLLSVF